MTDALLDRFLATLSEPDPAAPRDRARAVGRDLIARWDEPHRRYHTRTHLIAVLDALDLLLAGPPRPDDPDALRLAAWFHDAVYDGRPGDDEEASARLAERALSGLGESPARVAQVAALVRMTAGHAPSPDDVAGQLLADADLAVLAAPEPEYRAYCAAVRLEYAHVPDAAFAVGRSQLLRRLAAGEWIYATARGRALWEQAARANLRTELAGLDEQIRRASGG